MDLPLLPGYSLSRNVGRKTFHKSQHWVFCNNVSMLVDDSKPGIGGELLLGQKVKPKHSVFTKEVGSDTPSWVAFDKQVLSFDAYAEDQVHDASQGSYGVRCYKIFFYLEDDTIQVNEPKVRNSGLPQGTFIRRHRISLPPPDDDQFYTVHHFNVNTDVVLYGRTFKIYDCDAFTKNFLKKIGVKLNPPRQCPEDPSTKIKRKKQDCVKRSLPHQPPNPLKQFLQYDRKVLRFFCLWDDSASLFGDRRELILHYFLSDDTVEIIELLPHNSGRDAMPFFLQRRQLPKYGPPGLHQPGEVTDQTVLNMYGGWAVKQVHGYLLDKHKLGKSEQEFYKDSDLSIGTIINVWGRKVLLYDCDEFTKIYYKNKYEVENFTPIPCKATPPPKTERKFPPYTGFASEEDSLCSCVSLPPKPGLHLGNVRKFMGKDSYGNKSGVLRFLAKLITNQHANVGRLFIISYFLSDDTISVFEPTERKAVFSLRRFLKRMRVKKPRQEAFKSELSEYIKAEELYVGAKVNVNGHLFLLLSADEYTLKFMEKNSDMFPLSNLELVLEKLKEKISKSGDIRQVFRAADPVCTKKMDYNTFRDIVMTIAAGKLTEQELVTIARHYRVPDDPCPDVNVLIAMAHEQLKKNSFENFERLLYNCVYQDQEEKKLLPSKDIKRLCKSFRLPLSNDLLESLLSKFEDSEEQINYESFFCALNWRINTMPKQTAIVPLKERDDDVLAGMPSPISMKYIDYLKFLKNMYGLEEE